ncbi:MAG: glycoside hydrolase family 28 protein [Candidatus Hydrogenedentes bacterium]|nr:glycoside hydrolase family 28 protein [Candidatus Hydrogenedentota bacterium]
MRITAGACLGLVILAMWCPDGRAQETPPNGYPVKTYGAAGDGATKDTAAVQKAIDTCAANGGGTVYFAPGTYLCGSLHLRTGVTLWLDNGATIKGSPIKADYDPYEELGFENDSDHETSYFHFALIWGEDIERIGILGSGTIDGNSQKRGGPKPIALKRCRFVDIKGISIVNAPNYCISLLGTDDVTIDGVTIRNAYCDGIDPDCSRNVRISNCHIESWDDAIVPKASFSLGERRSTENITVTNCILSTHCNGFKLGTESGGDFKRIAVSNCVITGIKEQPAISGIALESVDGSNLDGVVVSNITMVNVRAPLYIRLGNRGRDMETPVPGSLRNVIINGVVATGGTLTSSVTGIPGHAVENVTLSDIQLTYAGGLPYCGPDEAIPEKIEVYPDADMYEALPAYGLYCRHVDGLTLSNVQLSYNDGFYRIQAIENRDIQWNAEGAPQPSAPGRPGQALLCDDVSALRISGLRARPSGEGDSVVRFANVRDALVEGCMAQPGTALYLEAVGKDSSGIRVIGNDLSHAKTAFTAGADVDAAAVELIGNAVAKQ